MNIKNNIRLNKLESINEYIMKYCESGCDYLNYAVFSSDDSDTSKDNLEINIRFDITSTRNRYEISAVRFCGDNGDVILKKVSGIKTEQMVVEFIDNKPVGVISMLITSDNFIQHFLSLAEVGMLVFEVEVDIITQYKEKEHLVLSINMGCETVYLKNKLEKHDCITVNIDNVSYRWNENA